MVDSASGGIIAFQSVAIRQSFRSPHDANSAAALSRKTIFLVLHRHHLVIEAALYKVEVEAVQGHQPGQQHVF